MRGARTMQTDASPAAKQESTTPIPAKAWGPPRLIVPQIAIALYWTLTLIFNRVDKAYFTNFFTGVGMTGLLLLFLFVWWWVNRRIRFLDRVTGFFMLIG